MFGFGRKRVRQVAQRIGRTAVICRDACRDADLQVLRNVMSSHNYVALPVSAERGAPIAAWIDGPPETADVTYAVTSDLDVDGKVALQMTAQGHDRLLGLLVIGGVGDLTVEVSDALRKTRGLGADTLAVQREMLSFPGFTSMDQIMGRLGVKRR